MKFPAWTVKLAAASAIPALVSVGVAISAPSFTVDSDIPAERLVSDREFTIGADGVDYAAMTGPQRAKADAVPACADPARRGDLRPC